jgi:hypothetical protein
MMMPAPFDFVKPKRRRAHAAEATVFSESALRSQRGTGILCLPPFGTEWFCGHVVWSSSAGVNRQCALLATELECDECVRCVLGGFQRFELKLTTSAPSVLTATAEVERTGGEMVRLRWIASADDRGDRARVEFDTHEMCTEARAAELLHRFFPNIARDATEADLRACVVCIGEMRLENIDFRPA